MLAGFGCHARGVELVNGDDRSAQASVRGKRSHTVDFRVADGKLLVKCSCPAESMGVVPCKHAWAALLEIDRQGALASLRTKRGLLALEREMEIAEPPRAKAAPPKTPARATRALRAGPAAKKTAATKKKARAKR